MAIFNIIQQFSIISTIFIIKINICLVKASKFLQQFWLVVHHKLGREYIIPDTLSKLGSANHIGYSNDYFKLNALFTYHAMLVKINPVLIQYILDDYLSNNWWAKVQRQLLSNKNLSSDRVVLFSVFRLSQQSSNSNPYFLLRPKMSDPPTESISSFLDLSIKPNKVQLIFYLNHMTGFY